MLKLVLTFISAVSTLLLAGIAAGQDVGPTGPRGQVVSLQSNVVGCQSRGAISPFEEASVVLDGVAFAYTPTPPASFPGGAAIAALYATGVGTNGQVPGQFCVDGACLANGNSCSAIAFIQPNGVRIYVRR